LSATVGELNSPSQLSWGIVPTEVLKNKKGVIAPSMEQ